MLKGKLWLSSLLVLCFLTLIGCGSGSANKNSKVIGEVNGDKITQAEFDTDYKVRNIVYDQQMEQYTKSSQSKDSNVKMESVKTPEIVAELKKQTWDDVVFQKLILQQAAKEGLDATDELEEATSSEDFKNTIIKYKLDEDTYKESLRTQLLYNQLNKKIIADVEVSDKEIEEYYKAHIGDFEELGGVEIYHILVKTEKEANDILAQVKAGADFAALAKKYSIDGSKEQGGYVGLANQDSGWVDEFQTAAMKLKPGELAPAPVRTQFGYHIIKAGSQKEGTNRSLKDANNEILMKLQSQKEQEVFNKYLDDVKKKAIIKDYRTKSSDKSVDSKKTKGK